ncbi:hypothetical protein TWF281_002782 [Arthrobotrys megalospora]
MRVLHPVFYGCFLLYSLYTVETSLALALPGELGKPDTGTHTHGIEIPTPTQVDRPPKVVERVDVHPSFFYASPPSVTCMPNTEIYLGNFMPERAPSVPDSEYLNWRTEFSTRNNALSAIGHRTRKCMERCRCDDDLNFLATDDGWCSKSERMNICKFVLGCYCVVTLGNPAPNIPGASLNDYYNTITRLREEPRVTNPDWHWGLGLSPEDYEAVVWDNHRPEIIEAPIQPGWWVDPYHLGYRPEPEMPDYLEGPSGGGERDPHNINPALLGGNPFGGGGSSGGILKRTELDETESTDSGRHGPK